MPVRVIRLLAAGWLLCAAALVAWAAPASATAGASAAPAAVQVGQCPLPVLRQGSSGPAVVQLQRLLHITADGSFGPVTRAAVVDEQTRRSRTPSGVVDATTWRDLGATCATPSATTRSRLDSRIRAQLASRTSSVSVAVYDRRTGATYAYRGDTAYDTASIVKVQVLATLLRRATVRHQPLSPAERDLASRMIRTSDNAATTQLWNAVGGANAVGAVDRALGMTHTVPGSGGYWGLTRTTATDQIVLLRQIAYGSRLLSSSDRAYMRSLMGSVVPAQRWGVSGGVPAGVTVELKNGWLPRRTHGWRINSIGHVTGQGRDYVIAILSQDNATMSGGVRTAEDVSGVVWRTLADPLR